MPLSLLVALLCFVWLPLFAAQPACDGRAAGVAEISGSVTEDGSTGNFVRRTEAGTGRMFEMIKLGELARGEGFDGKLAWSQDVSGAVHDLNSPFARALSVSQAWLDGRMDCLAPGVADQVFVGTKVEGARHFAVWQETPAGGAPIELWYDEANGQLDRAAQQQAESRLVRHFSDWRKAAGGPRLPFRERDEYIEQESETVFQASSITTRARARQDDFARPPQPQDAAILGARHTADIAYEDDHRTRIYIPVWLNGHGPFTFELDAGGHFILGEQTAAAIGLAPKGSFSSTGAGEAVMHVGFARVSEVKIGQAVMSNQMAKILPLSAQANDRGPLSPRAGILGLELFERFTVGLDRRRKMLTLRLRGEDYPQPAGQRMPLLFDEDAPLIEGKIEASPGTLMLDTGNAGATIVEDFWAQHSGVASVALPVSFGDGVGYGMGTIQIGTERFAGETLSAFGPALRGSEYTRSVAAVLGEPFLSRFNTVYDYARNVVWLDELPGARAVPFNRSGLLLDKTPDGRFTVKSVIDGAPGAQAGVTKGDVIDAIAGKAARLLSRADANALFKQPPGTAVTLETAVAATHPHTHKLILRDLLHER